MKVPERIPGSATLIQLVFGLAEIDEIFRVARKDATTLPDLAPAGGSENRVATHAVQWKRTNEQHGEKLDRNA